MLKLSSQNGTFTCMLRIILTVEHLLDSQSNKLVIIMFEACETFNRNPDSGQ